MTSTPHVQALAAQFALAALLAALLAASSATSAAAASAPAAHERPLPVATSQPERVRRALDLVEQQREEAIAAWIELCRIPALPKHEAERARAYQRALVAAGLPARVLPDGNVEARWAGTEAGPPAILSAHLDALHAPSAERPVRRVGQSLTGPGVLDDGSGLASILAAVKALRACGWQPARELRIVATVGEEIGLVGARSYLGSNSKEIVVAFVSVDGILGRVDHGATGIRWTRFTLSGPGGHTLLASQLSSPSFAAGRAIAGRAALAERSDALLNVSELRGGSAPNAVPTEVSFTVDLRSDDPAQLSKLLADCDRIVRDAAATEGVTVGTEILQDLPAARLPGMERSALVTTAASILRHVGVAPIVSSRGSSDHNVALLRGIPAIAVGATTGRNAHAPEETADLEPFTKGVRQVLLLTVLLGEGLQDAESAQ